MVTIHMMVGIPASGKTTYARELSKIKDLPVISTDEIRNLYPTVEEKDIWPKVYDACRKLISEGKDFIFDATNITPNVRNRFKEEMQKQEKAFSIGTYFFDTPTEICYERIIARNRNKSERYFPPEVIASYGEKIIAPTADEKFIFMKIITNR